MPSGVTDDVFAGLSTDGIPFHPAPGFTSKPEATPSIHIGDPWNFYHEFWAAHGLDDLRDIVPTEVTVKVGGTLWIPLIIENPLDHLITVNLSVEAPPEWRLKPSGEISIDPHTRYFARIQADAPDKEVPGWQNFTVAARSGDQKIGSVPVRAQLSTGWVAPQ